MTNGTNPTSASRADLHCHSTAFAVAKLGVQRALPAGETAAGDRPPAGDTPLRPPTNGDRPAARRAA